MRHCVNETVDVYEAQSATLAEQLREAADLVESHEGYAKVTSMYYPEGGDMDYVTTVYLH